MELKLIYVSRKGNPFLSHSSVSVKCLEMLWWWVLQQYRQWQHYYCYWMIYCKYSKNLIMVFLLQRTTRWKVPLILLWWQVNLPNHRRFHCVYVRVCVMRRLTHNLQSPRLCPRAGGFRMPDERRVGGWISMDNSVKIAMCMCVGL